MNNRFYSLIVLVGCMILNSTCSKEEEGTPLPPTIPLEQESPIYQVKVGGTLTISPIVENAGSDAIFLWKIDGKIVGRERTFTYQAGSEPAMMYVKFEVTTEYGTAEQEFSLEVVPYLKPQIALGVPEEGYTVIVEGELTFTPEVTNGENARFVWSVDGNAVAETKDYTFSSKTAGNYTLALTATNEDGSDKVEFKVKVCSPEEMPFTALFEQTTYNMSLGRTIFIRPYRIENAFDATYTWSVDGNEVTDLPVFSNPRVASPECAACTFAYTPGSEGTHTVVLTMKNRYGTVPTTFTVNVAPQEGESPRGYTGSVDCNKVYEFTAAPGQFVNEHYDAYTPEEACNHAMKCLDAKGYVSLGSWGGYVIVGFDHSIKNDGDYNLQILGNAFQGSSEPGIVWVMQDENRNGLPDDTWYELKGSDYSSSTQDYAVTYYKPAGTNRPVAWTDNVGGNGQVDYLGFHTQDYYYPNWIKTESYTLVGSRLQSRTSGGGNAWVNGEYGWGYADNFSPVDRLTDDENPNADIMGNHMRISDAVRHDGKPANLKYIDFVKIHTGVNVKAGWLGENSTEVFGVQDYNMIKNQ